MIRSITFKKDFRSFKKDDAFTFKPGVNILVGDQGSGKSTLIELLRSISKPKYRSDDSSWRAMQIDNVNTIVSIEADKQVVIAFDFERESGRDKSALHFDMIDMQIGAMRSSHGQGNLMAIDRVLSKTKKELETVGTVMLDEPDAAMSVRNVYGLVRMINGIASKWKKQVIVSAHNPILINGIDPLVKGDAFWTEVLSLEHKAWMGVEEFISSQLVPLLPLVKKEKK